MIEAHISGRSYSLTQDKENGQWSLDGTPVTADVQPSSDGGLHMLVDGRSVHVRVEEGEGKMRIVEVNGHRFEVNLKDHYDRLLDQLGMSRTDDVADQDLKAPMPGKVLSITVTEGQVVSKGDPLLILEAMKMENVIKAPADAVVGSILCTQGAAVEKNTVLIAFN